jgi:hypothetical protein
MNESGTYAMDSTNKLQNFFTGEEIRNAVARDLGMDQFNGSAGIERLGNSNMLKVSVRADSPTLAYQEMQSIIRNYEKIASELIINMKMAVLETPKLPEAPANSKQNVKYALALGIAAFVIVCTWLAARYFVRDAARRSKRGGKKRSSKSSADQKERIVDADIDLDPARLVIDVLDGFFEKAWLFIILMIIGGALCFFAARLRYTPYYEAVSKRQAWKRPPAEKYTYLDISLGIGGKTLLEDWHRTQSLPKSDPEYCTEDFTFYMAYSLHAKLMRRYARRWASGISADLFYGSYADHVKDLDERAKRNVAHSPWSVGVSASHSVFYHNASLQMTLGYYLYREMGFSAKDIEKPYYERIGLYYTLPSLHDLTLGVSLNAHMTKADFTELVISYPIKL